MPQTPGSLRQRRDAICQFFADCESLRTTGFVGVGFTVVAGAPKLLILSKKPDATRQAIASHFPLDFDDNLYVQSAGFDSQDPSLFSRSLRYLRRLVPGGRRADSHAVATLTLKAGGGVDDGSPTFPAAGTIGCLLQDTHGTAYALTAGHVLSRGMQAYAMRFPLGRVVDSSSFQTGLDWALIEIASPHPTISLSDQILAENGLSLTGPLKLTDLPGLVGQTIGMTGSARRKRCEGTVLAWNMCVMVMTNVGVPCQSFLVKDQIIVMNLPNQDPFGAYGDSGAVAYVTTGAAAGAAVGQYWRTDGVHHALAPLANVLTAVDAARSDTFSLWP